jgi:glycerophosphoryl diester phosphodiesterase
VNLHSTSFFLTGHRGCRGLYPENTITGFLQTLLFPVNTIELDVVISGDGQVVVSHEGWMHEEFCLKPDGTEITAEEAQSHNLYRMTYPEIIKYDCGMKVHPRFPGQKKLRCIKPLLHDVIFEIEKYQKIIWDIELKSVPEEYGVFQPAPEVMTEKVLEVLGEFDLQDRLIIRSFDYAPLQYLDSINSPIPLCLIVEDKASAEQHFEKLGFVPFMYSPDFELVTEEMIRLVHGKNCKLVPWTVNELADMKRLKAMGADGLITDYPDRFTLL